MTEVVDGPPPSAEAKLAALAEETGRSVADLTTEAVDRLCRIYVGDPVNGPKDPTAPFRKRFSPLPAEIVVRQVTPVRFELREPMRYVDGGRTFDVLMGDISDFASVPRFLTWLIPRYGQHTMAALLHDHLQHHLVTRKHPRPDDPEAVSSAEADTIFRQALRYSAVPFLRRWVMWAAVSLRTVLKSGMLGASAVVVWVLLFGVLGLAWPALPPIAAASPALGWRLPLLAVGAAFLLPLVLCWLWFRWWRLGLITGLTLAIVALPCLFALVAAGLYFAAEALVRAVLREPTALIGEPPSERNG